MHTNAKKDLTFLFVRDNNLNPFQKQNMENIQ